MGLELRLGHRSELGQSQKLEAKRLLKLVLELKEQGFKEAVRGLEGIKRANDILQKRNLAGLLVGGMAKSIHDPRRDVSKFAEHHKDTDVIIFGETEEYAKIKKFEGGVDWWSTETREVPIVGRDSSKYNLNVKFHRNGNGVMLHYKLDKYRVELESGLYIPDYEIVRQIESSMLNTLADLSSTTGMVDDGVIDFAYEKMDLPEIRDQPPMEVSKASKGELSCGYISADFIEAQQFRGVRHQYLGQSPFH